MGVFTHSTRDSAHLHRIYAQGRPSDHLHGEKPTSEFLFLHGFVLQSNQNTQIQFPAPFIELSMLDTDMHGMEEVEEEKPMADASIASSSSVQDHGMGKDVLTDMTYDTVASTRDREIDTARLDGC
ncbi:hypothetical protein BSLG_004935, partial [Batrachochytrium salamandrivorans]